MSVFEDIDVPPTRVPPTDGLILPYTEKQEIKTTMRMLEEKLHKIEADIEELIARRNVYQRARRTLCEAVAPNRLLPYEVVAEVFAWLHATHLEDSPDSDCIVLPFPAKCPPWQWALRQICSLWRAIALQQSSLWKDIAIVASVKSENSDLGPNSPCIKHRLAGILELVRTLVPPEGPLQLRIRLDSMTSFDAQAVFKLVHKVLLSSFRTRVRYLEVQCHFPHLIHFYKLDLSHLSNLTCLSFNDHPGSHHIRVPLPQLLSYDDVLRFSRRFEVATSNLSRVHLCSTPPGSPMLMCALDLGLPWRQVTHLEIKEETSVSASESMDVLDILMECGCLEILKIDLPYQQPDSEEAPDVHDSDLIRLPCLRSLSIRLDDEYFLRFLSLPSLSHLELRATYEPPPSQIMSLIRRSGCDLRSFRDGVDAAADVHEILNQNRVVTQAQFYDLLNCMPNLQTFDSVTRLTIFDLRRIASGALLAKATSLGISYRHPLKLLMDTLRPRLKLNSNLRREVAGLDEVHVRCASLEQFTEAGMKVQVTTESLTAAQQVDGTIFRFSYDPRDAIRIKMRSNA